VSPLLDDAVAGGGIVLADTGERREFCTFSRVAPGWLLTAKHCVGFGSSPSSPSLEFTFQKRFPRASTSEQPDSPDCAGEEGDEDALGSTVQSSPIEQTVLHESLDLALLRVEIPDGASLTIAEEPPCPEEPVLLVGYGLQETGEGGVQEQLWATVSSLEDGIITVIAEQGGACVGDSGGPLLRRRADGRFELLGVLSTGSATCTSFDHYVDMTRAGDWLKHALRR
jgi:hypothetical protein